MSQLKNDCETVNTVTLETPLKACLRFRVSVVPTQLRCRFPSL